MITLKNINKYYNAGSEKYHALRNINITFPDKGMFFIVGKSGSGKSTLLNVIGGIDGYDSGELIIDDINTKNFSKSDYNTYRNSYIGFIFQEFNVVKNLNVYDNIALSLRLQNKNIKENHELILETIKKVGLDGKEKRKMNQLSGGERQRVAIARAIIKQPRVIIADEPTGNLDKNNRDTVMNTLKELSESHLVIIVTHDNSLSERYGDEKITIKDGQIVDHTKFNEVSQRENEVIVPEQVKIRKITPSIKASFFLSFKSLKQNLARFIMITIFFIIALIFSNTTINLYFSNATLEYSKYQQDYNNEYISISREETLYGEKVQSGFFQIDTLSYKNLITSFNSEDNEQEYQIFHSFNSAMPINQNADEFVDTFYSSCIDNIIVLEKIDYFTNNDLITYVENNLLYMPIRCFITDYIADSLIINNYFEDNATLDIDYTTYFADKFLTVDGMSKPIYIEGVISTNYKDFLEQDINDPNVYASFTDNKIFYNSIFFRSSVYVDANDGNQFVSTYNMSYIYDDFIYSGLGKEGMIKDVKVRYFDEDCVLVKGKGPIKHLDEGESLDQIVISTALLEQAYGIPLDELIFTNDKDQLISLVNPDTGNTASFNFNGYRRVNVNFNCEIVGIVESDEPTIYFCNPSETSLYYKYIKLSYSDYDNSTKSFGGKLVIKITDDINKNTILYQTLGDNNIRIDNLSYTKLQVVNEFIDNNLILFIGIFFALCMFSILMIFNFVVITIKNSTKDIGIYMSLGMNGLHIAFIYVLQILIVSTVTFLLSSIGATIFLNILDNTLSIDASLIINEQYNLNMYPINFETFKMTLNGIFISMGIAYIFPFISVLIPLFRLARKKPIDVLKIS